MAHAHHRYSRQADQWSELLISERFILLDPGPVVARVSPPTMVLAITRGGHPRYKNRVGLAPRRPGRGAPRAYICSLQRRGAPGFPVWAWRRGLATGILFRADPETVPGILIPHEPLILRFSSLTSWTHCHHVLPFFISSLTIFVFNNLSALANRNPELTRFVFNMFSALGVLGFMRHIVG